jgi:tetratricopeptide (TPR) repeat protein
MPKTVAGTDLAKGVAAMQGGDLTSAKSFLESAIKKNPKDAEALYYLGVVLEKSNDKAGAEKAYKDALTVKPDLDEASSNLAAIYVDSQKFDEAIKLLKTALAKHPDDHALRTNLAVAYAGKGDEKAARKAFEDAVKIAPNDPNVLFMYGHQLGVWKDNTGALVQLRAARAAAGDQAPLIAAVGFEMKALGAFGDCVPTYDKAISIKPAAEYYMLRGLCKMGAKDDAGSMSDFQQSATKDPNFAPGHFYYGNALARQGKWDDAIREYEAYLKLDPNGAMAKQAAERLKIAQGKKAGGGAPPKK